MIAIISYEDVKEMDPIAGLSELTFRLNDGRTGHKPSIHLSVSPAVSGFSGFSKILETLIERFINHVQSASYPTTSVQVLVHEKTRIEDLESFFATSPTYWFHLSVQSQAAEGFEKAAKAILEDAGYSCVEWIGVEGTDSQLGAFCHAPQGKLTLVLFIENRGARRKCDFLIPVTVSVPPSIHLPLN